MKILNKTGASMEPWGTLSLSVTSVISCDISQAFDRVWHTGLIYKLKQSGISGNLLKRFQNYPHGREHSFFREENRVAGVVNNEI
jgi:hypothetical protein